MTDTFSFNAPSISPGYPPKPSVWATARPTSSGGIPYHSPMNSAERHQSANAPAQEHSHGASSSDEDERLPTPVGPPGHHGGPNGNGGGRPSGHFSRGPSPGSHQPPPVQYGQHSGVNMRNTRPMTAPSSISQPYFTAHYTPGGPPVSSSFYNPAQFPGQGPPPHRPNPFQYQVDQQPQHAPEGDFRGRNFSLPELVGGSEGGEGLPDEPRYGAEGPRMGISSNSPPSTFLYGAPPLPDGVPSPAAFYANHPGAGGSSPDESGQYSRPNTGDSHSTSSSHTTVGPPPSTFHLARRPYSSGGDDSHHETTGKVYNFIAQPGQTTKRPRRRYDEIERLYTCDYPGCTKAYGTLNHLNSHKTMQKHGPKSTPAQFKELRKAWREGKKAAAAAAARQLANDGGSPANRGGDRARPRPSTSAGEYHYNVPAPFMSSLGTPIPSYPLPSAPLAAATHFPIAALHPPAWGGGYPPMPTYDPHGPAMYHQQGSPHRPVTAPSSFYSAPTFGFNHHPGEQQPGHPAPFPLPERRLSLPGNDGGQRPMSAHGNFAFSPVETSGFPSIIEEAPYPPGIDTGASNGDDDGGEHRNLMHSRGASDASR